MAVRILVILFRMPDDTRVEREPIARVLEGQCDLVFKNALAGEIDWSNPQKELEGFSGVVLSGSSILYFDGGHDEEHHGRVMANELAEKARPFTQYLIEHDIPTLGICFGHQLLGYATGTPITYSHIEGKTGTHEITLTEEGKKDPLMKGVPPSFKAQYGHKDVLCELPNDSTVLAQGGERCRYSAVKFNTHVYGMQFHPEYSREEIQRMVARFPEYVPEDTTIEELFEDSEEAEQILKNFAGIAVPKERLV
jgi:GMP synthase (glutamine-hydrolysing)